MGSEESHFNVSVIVRDKVTRQCSQTTTFEERGEPKRNVNIFIQGMVKYTHTHDRVHQVTH